MTNKTAILHVRTRPAVKQAAAELAARDGRKLSAWVEQLIIGATQAKPRSQAATAAPKI